MHAQRFRRLLAASLAGAGASTGTHDELIAIVLAVLLVAVAVSP